MQRNTKPYLDAHEIADCIEDCALKGAELRGYLTDYLRHQVEKALIANGSRCLDDSEDIEAVYASLVGEG